MKHTPDTIKKIIADKVSGVWQPDHDAEGHHYLHTPTGVRVDSTTSKLAIIDKPHLKRWMIKQAIEWLEQEGRFAKLATEERNTYMIGAQEAYTGVRDDAGSVGSLAHQVVENYINHWLKTGKQPSDIRQGFPPNPDSRAVASARSVERFFNEHKVEPVASEILVGSVKRNIAGTLDFLCFLDGKLALIDFKTSNSVDDTYALQVADYTYSFKEMTGITIKEIKILWLSKDYDQFKVYDIPNLKSAYRAMKAVSDIYDWKFNNEKKLVESKKIIKL